MTRTIAFAAALLLAAAPASAADPKVSDDVVKIGVLTDMTGFYSDLAGPGSVLAVKMAVDDFGGNIELVTDEAPDVEPSPRPRTGAAFRVTFPRADAETRAGQEA